MTGAAFFLLSVATAAAVGDWLAVRAGRRGLEYLCKPLTMVALIGVAVALDPRDGAVRAWFVAALVASLVGDVFLMLPRDQFLAGLGSFLVAHLAYVGGFLTDRIDGGRLLAGLALVALALAVVGIPVLRGAGRTDPALSSPLLVYMAVISAMVACAVGTGRPLAIAGAASFYASDALIGLTRFIRPISWGPLAIMVTYHTGQTLLTLSLV